MNRLFLISMLILVYISLAGYTDIGIKITNNPVMMNYNQFDVVWFASFGVDKVYDPITFFFDGDINLYSVYWDVSYGRFSGGIDAIKYYNNYDKFRCIAKLKGESDVYFDEYMYYGGYANIFNINYFNNFMLKEATIIDITEYPNLNIYSEKYIFPYLWLSFFWDSSSIYIRNGLRLGYYNGGNLIIYSSMIGFSKGITDNSGMYVRFYMDKYISQNYTVSGISDDMDDYFLSKMFYEGYTVKGGYSLNTDNYDFKASLELYNKKYSPVIYTDFSSVREDYGGIITIDYIKNGYTNDAGISFSIKNNFSDVKPYKSYTVKLFLGL